MLAFQNQCILWDRAARTAKNKTIKDGDIAPWKDFKKKKSDKAIF